MCPVARCRRGLRRDLSGSALPTLPQSVSRGARFRGFTGSPLLRPVRLLAPLDGSDRVSPATGGFYIQASGGLVARPAAGYDYNSLWTPLLAGLSPAGMAASLAAPDPFVLPALPQLRQVPLPASPQVSSRRCGLSRLSAQPVWPARQRPTMVRAPVQPRDHPRPSAPASPAFP